MADLFQGSPQFWRKDDDNGKNDELERVCHDPLEDGELDDIYDNKSETKEDDKAAYQNFGPRTSEDRQKPIDK